jgi:Zn-dependent M28 family amino/carboxypeptidase
MFISSSVALRIILVGTLALLLCSHLPAQSVEDSSYPTRDATVVRVVREVRRDSLEKSVRALAAFPTRHTLSGATGADAAANWIAKEFTAISNVTGKRLQVKKEVWVQPAGTRMNSPETLTNVLAVLPGTLTGEDERIIIVSGHYDSRVTDVMNATSRAPGANDDASGVAVVLELARTMSQEKFPCTIIFAAVTGEEQALLGSTHLAQRMTAEKKNVIAMFTNDIVGNSRGANGKKDDKHLRIFSAGYTPVESQNDLMRRRAWGTDADSPSRTLARTATDAVRRYIKGFTLDLIYRNDRYGRGGDHTPFLEQGFAACRFTEPNENWDHQHQDLRTEKGVIYGDLPEYVDYAYLARVAQVNAAVVADLAAAPATPSRVALKGDLSAETTLTFVAPSDAVAVEILWRKTSSPDWEGFRRFPVSDRQAILPISKDDYLFAVRSVSKSGSRSLPAIPVSSR